MCINNFPQKSYLTVKCPDEEWLHNRLIMLALLCWVYLTTYRKCMTT